MIGLSSSQLRASAQAGDPWQTGYRIYVLICREFRFASLPFDDWKQHVIALGNSVKGQNGQGFPLTMTSSSGRRRRRGRNLKAIEVSA